MLLVYLGGIVMCALWWRRAPQAAMLAMAGLGLLLLTTVGFSFLQMYLIQNRPAGQSAQSLGQTMMWLGLGMSVLRAIGTGLLVAGVFVGRPQVVARSGFDVQHYEPQQPPAMR